MSLPRNPRRRSPGSQAGANGWNSLLKGASFHSPSSPSSCEPIGPSSPPTDGFVPPRLLRRPQTDLDDVVNACRRRAALIVSEFDKTLSNGDELSSLVKLVDGCEPGLKDETLPVPRIFLEPQIIAEPETIPNVVAFSRRLVRQPSGRRSSRHSHGSDSGIGSSIFSSTDKKRHADRAIKPAPIKSTMTTPAVNRSAAAAPPAAANLRGLSRRAVNRIHEHILRPLLDKPTLREFEPLLLDIPRRMSEKQIVCLRDLEKMLVFIAPAKTKTAAAQYLDLCLTSIRCIQATVVYLSDREQIRFDDRPYTNGYFIDLKGQILEYARQLGGLRETGPAAVDHLNLDIADEIRLHGGIAETGQPAELIRVKQDGSAFSLATGKPVDLQMEDAPACPRMKRSLSEQADDEEEIQRSMARRKKNAPIEELAPRPCREPGCLKMFKRACDLTKHEKTHLRPWKCRIESCKYHDRGWPTEKELDRHWNDKHSSDPAMFCCHFAPCPYKSKRESNCKQHMEKAHGWHYVRQKTTAGSAGAGGNKKSNPASTCGGGADLGFPSLSPITNPYTSMPTPPNEDYQAYTPPFHGLECPTYPSDQEYLHALGPIPLTLEVDDMEFELPAMPGQERPPFEAFGNTFQSGSDFIVGDDIYAAVAHLPSPSPVSYVAKMEPTDVSGFDMDRQVGMGLGRDGHVVPFSPGAESDAMLYTPRSNHDDCGGEDLFKDDGGHMSGSFQLFRNDVKMNLQTDVMFGGEIPSSMLSFSQQPTQEIFPGQPMELAQLQWGTDSHQHQHQQLSFLQNFH